MHPGVKCHRPLESHAYTNNNNHLLGTILISTMIPINPFISASPVSTLELFVSAIVHRGEDLVFVELDNRQASPWVYNRAYLGR